jgi:K+-transporting ATPase KdpF subunit
MKDLVTEELLEVFRLIASKRNRVPWSIFFLMCFNLLLVPMVSAATPGETERWQIYSISLLGLTTIALSIYLFVVIFQPERF